MNFVSIFKIAIRAINSNKVRTGLTALGLVIGISSIIIVFSAGEGITSLLTEQIEAFGSDIVETEIKVPSNKKGLESEQQSAISLFQGVQVTSLTVDDMKDINKLPNVEDSYAAVMSQEPVIYGGEMKRTTLYGVSASFIDIDKSEIEFGRFFTDSEDKGIAPVAVIGKKMKEDLFGEDEAIGKTIKIRKVPFKVIGVMQEQGAVFGFDFDELTYVPVRTLQKRVMGINYLHAIMHKIIDVNFIEETSEDIRVILRENHNISQPEVLQDGWMDTGRDDFRVVPITEILEVWDSVTGTLTILLLAIVAVSLVVGGVGIMNVMYVIVNERTREIGLRKAVGAKYSNIMFQFLIESVLITLAGGIIGILFGIMVSYLISLGANSAGLDWSFGVPIRAFVIAIIFSIAFGILFGLYPARKAARLDPVTALRAE